MNAELRGPAERYSLAVEVLASPDGRSFARHRSTTGALCRDDSNSPGSGPGSDTYRVVVDDCCSLHLAPGENGLMVRGVRLLSAAAALITAVVTAGAGAPPWLPSESTYLIFQGDRPAAAALKERYIPFDGLITGGSGADEEHTTLDRLAAAVGRSVARANAVLARTRAQGGVALVSSVTVRTTVNQINLGQGQVRVTLARAGEKETGQFVELTMTTVPGATPEEDAGGLEA